jgi:hypothetical protein
MDKIIEHNDDENVDEISKLTQNTDALETIFSEPTTLLKEMFDSFENKSYTIAIEDGKKVLEIMESPMQEYMKMGMAVSISAAARWSSSLGEVGVDTGQIEELITQARRNFASHDFKEVNRNIEKVREMIPDLEEAQKDIARKRITDTEEIIKEARGTGASLIKAERALEQARNFLEVGNYTQVAILTEEAQEEANASKTQRVQTTSDALLFTRSIIEESKDIGVDTKEPEALFKKAKKAFGKGDFAESAELNKQAEELALKLQDEHMDKVIQLKQKRESMKNERETELKEKDVGDSKMDEEEEKNTCPTCDSSVRFVKKYNRYWCKECKKYTPKK